MFNCNACRGPGYHLAWCWEGLAPWEKNLLTGNHPEPMFSDALLVVTHLDGTVTKYPETRYLARLDGGPDPIKRLDSTTLEIENMDQSFVVMNVRSYTMEF